MKPVEQIRHMRRAVSRWSADAGRTSVTRIRRHGAVVLVACLTFAGATKGKDAPAFKTIDVPNAVYTSVNALSEDVAVGEADDAAGGIHGYVLDRGTFRSFDAPAPASLTILNGVNEKGELSGVLFDTAARGFVWSRGVLTLLVPPGATRAQAGQINDRGQVAGFFRDSTGKRRGYVWDKGNYKIFNAPNDHVTGGTVAWSVNNRGDVVGSFVDTDVNRHGFLLRDGKFTILDPPGSLDTIAWGINDEGAIVGQYFTDRVRGFVFRHGVYTTIDIPNGQNISPNTISNNGVVGGSYDDATGATHGFIARVGSLDVETGKPVTPRRTPGAVMMKRDRLGRD